MKLTSALTKSNLSSGEKVKTEYGWYTSPQIWEQLKPLAREKRRVPTPAENRLWQHLRRRRCSGFKFRRQHTIDRFITDFYCPSIRLVIEVDGPIHQYTPEEDAIRQAFLENAGLQVLRFTNAQVEEDLDSVLRNIKAALGPERQET